MKKIVFLGLIFIGLSLCRWQAFAAAEIRATDGLQIIDVHNLRVWWSIPYGTYVKFSSDRPYVTRPGEIVYLRQPYQGKFVWVRMEAETESLLGYPEVADHPTEATNGNVPPDFSMKGDGASVQQPSGDEPNASGRDRALDTATGSALQYGFAQLFYRNFIVNSNEKKQLEKYEKQIEDNSQETEKNRAVANEEVARLVAKININFQTTHFDSKFDAGGFLKAKSDDHYQIKSPPGPFRNQVEEVRNSLLAIETFDSHHEVARKIGLKMTEVADKVYSEGKMSEARVWIHAAAKMGDIAIGWDPVTGPARGLCEFVAGINCFTWRPLTSFERAIAGLNVITDGLTGDLIKPAEFLAKLLGVSEHFETKMNALRTAKEILQSSIVKEKGLKLGVEIIEKMTKKFPNLGTNYSSLDKLRRLGLDVGSKLGDVHRDNEIHFGHKFEFAPSTSALNPGDVSKIDGGVSGLQVVTLHEGDVIYQTTVPGEKTTAFGLIKKGSTDHLDSIASELTHDTRIDGVKVYVVQENTAAYLGTINGGTAVKLLIPFEEDYFDIIREVESIKWPNL